MFPMYKCQCWPIIVNVVGLIPKGNIVPSIGKYVADVCSNTADNFEQEKAVDISCTCFLNGFKHLPQSFVLMMSTHLLHTLVLLKQIGCGVK